MIADGLEYCPLGSQLCCQGYDTTSNKVIHKNVSVLIQLYLKKNTSGHDYVFRESCGRSLQLPHDSILFNLSYDYWQVVADSFFTSFRSETFSQLEI